MRTETRERIEEELTGYYGSGRCGIARCLSAVLFRHGIEFVCNRKPWTMGGMRIGNVDELCPVRKKHEGMERFAVLQPNRQP